MVNFFVCLFLVTLTLLTTYFNSQDKQDNCNSGKLNVVPVFLKYLYKYRKYCYLEKL